MHENQQKGKQGETAVALKFLEIDWGTVPNTSEDLGTDIWVQVRDDRRFDLGLLLGVQVKTGSTCFNKPKTGDEGALIGWWYAEPKTHHFDYWSAHSVPHLLVLHNLDSNTSYWVHVTASSIDSTGNGCKILVPATQTIDADHRDDLMAVAYQQRPVYELEGSAIEGEARDISPGQQLRHALVAPRLIAPHRNFGYQDEIDAVQAVALLAQGRFRDLKRFANEHQSVPDPESTDPRPDWTWQFVSAIWDWAMTDSHEQLSATFDSAFDNRTKVASGIFLSCALQRMEQYAEALDVLNSLVAIDRLEPADHGWVLVQRARTRAEIGDVDGCRADATTAKDCLEPIRGDLTVSVFVSAASSQLIATREPQDLTGSDFRGLTTAADHTVSWWRSLTILWALSESVDSRFKSWADNRATVLFGEDREARYLFSAELMADLAGEHSAWRAIATLGARQKLVRAVASDDEQELLTEGLNALRRSGDNQSLRAALSHLHRVGPIESVAAAVKMVPQIGWTHTTAASNFEALAQAGDLLDEQTATEFLIWSARVAAGDSAVFRKTVRPAFVLEHHALKAVTRLLPAASAHGHTELASLLAALPTPPPESLVQDLAAVINNIGFDLLADSEHDGLWNLCQQDQGPVGNALLGWFAANGKALALTQLKDRAVNGDLDALSVIGDVTALDNGEAAGLIENVEIMAAVRLSDAKKHRHSFGGFDAGSILALLNLWFPEEARWDTVVAMLTEPLVTTHDKRRMCYLISELSARVPDDLRSHLASNIEGIRRAVPFFQEEPGTGGIGLLLALAVGAISNDDAAAAATKLAFGSRRDRQDLAQLLGLGHCPRMQPMLATLVGDRQFEVRHASAEAVGRLVASESNTTLHVLIRETASKDGTGLPLALLAGLSQRDAPLPEIGSEIAQQLQTHPSALVRLNADRLLR